MVLKNSLKMSVLLLFLIVLLVARGCSEGLQIIDESSTDDPSDRLNSSILQEILLKLENLERVAWQMKQFENVIEKKVQQITNHLNAHAKNLTSYRTPFAQDCSQILKPTDPSGVYTLDFAEWAGHFQAYCMQDAEQKGAAWTVIQRRVDDAEDFKRFWHEYEDGFGDADGSYWLGLENIHQMTKRKNYELWIDMEDFEGERRHAKYSRFYLNGPEAKYRLRVSGYHGNAGDALQYHDGQKFTTCDNDNDNWVEGNCASKNLGSWWFNRCYHSNLNGVYDVEEPRRNIVWSTWRGYEHPLKYVHMAVRPRSN